MSEEQAKHQKEAWFTLSGDVNSDMVHRVFEAVSGMTEDGIDTAHILLQSNGGYVSDGLCLYNFMARARRSSSSCTTAARWPRSR